MDFRRGPSNFSKNSRKTTIKNGLTAMIEEPLPGAYTTPAIIDYVLLHFKNMAPIHKWLLSVLG